MQTICTSLQTDNHTNTSSLNLITRFFTGRMLFVTPSQQCQSTEGNTNMKLHPAIEDWLLKMLFETGALRPKVAERDNNSAGSSYKWLIIVEACIQGAFSVDKTKSCGWWHIGTAVVKSGVVVLCRSLSFSVVVVVVAAAAAAAVKLILVARRRTSERI